jgi:tetratricopeptide (TPR) repeat protein
MSEAPHTEQLLADSRLAFLNQQNDMALSLAKEAIEIEPHNADAYKCAGNASMSLECYDEAIKNYSLAVKHDPDNGNRNDVFNGIGVANRIKLPYFYGCNSSGHML